MPVLKLERRWSVQSLWLKLKTKLLYDVLFVFRAQDHVNRGGENAMVLFEVPSYYNDGVN